MGYGGFSEVEDPRDMTVSRLGTMSSQSSVNGTGGWSLAYEWGSVSLSLRYRSRKIVGKDFLDKAGTLLGHS